MVPAALNYTGHLEASSSPAPPEGRLTQAWPTHLPPNGRVLSRATQSTAGPSGAAHRLKPSGHQHVPCNGQSVTVVTCGPGPQTGKHHGTSCRPQTGYRLQVKAVDGRGQGARSMPAGGPRPLLQILQRHTGGHPLRPLHGPQTPPLGTPQGLDLKKHGVFRELESRK